jgi:hypothetical protein
VDPVGLLEAEKTLESPITINLEGVPLAVSLELGLRQLGLFHYVRGGVLIVESVSGSEFAEESAVGNEEDPYLISGRCLITCLAACLGGLLAPTVSDA